MTSHSLETTYQNVAREIGVRIFCDFTPGDRGQLYEPAENCYPSSYPEVELNRVQVLGPNGPLNRLPTRSSPGPNRRPWTTRKASSARRWEG
jgi:hypothetical protein